MGYSQKGNITYTERFLRNIIQFFLLQLNITSTPLNLQELTILNNISTLTAVFKF